MFSDLDAQKGDPTKQTVPQILHISFILDDGKYQV